MTPALVFKEGPLTGRRVEIDAELVVGREDEALTIEDDEISRRHAVIRPGDGVIEIEDLGSTNGTYVNGVRIEGATRLAGGDTIKLGRSVLEVESVRAAATLAAAVPAARATPAPTATASPSKRSRGIASRQLISFAAVAATAVALVRLLRRAVTGGVRPRRRRRPT